MGHLQVLCATPPSTIRADVAVHGDVKALNNFRGGTKTGAQNSLACRSSLFLQGRSDLARSAVRKQVKYITSRGARCESQPEGKGSNRSVDIWIGRTAMIGFAAAITTEIVTGKGVLANVGVSSPQPTIALALAALIGGLVSFGVFRSAAEE